MTFNALELPNMPSGVAIGTSNLRGNTLNSVPGLTLSNQHQGVIALDDNHRASFQIEAIGLMRIELASLEGSPEKNLAKNGDLPGSARFALDGQQMLVLAELLVRDEHPSQMLNDLETARAGLLQAVGQQPEQSSVHPPLTKELVAEALAASAIVDEDIVDLETEWEVRTRWHEDAAVVRLHIDGGQLRCRRVLLKNIPSHADVLAHQALRFNHQLRQCRLAMRQSQLVAEAMISHDDVNSAGVENLARTVAVAARHCEGSLKLLAAEQELADRYKAMFINS